MIKKLVFLFLLLLFVYLFKGYENKIFSFNFVDEEDNMAIGKYLANGEKLFSDIYTNHQPMTYIMSAAVQKLTQPNSIPMLVKRHREFVFAWSLIWAIFLIYRFGPFMLFSIVPYELSKHYFIGNLFLAESFAVYPCIYLVALLYKERKKLSKKEYLFIGMNSFFLLFSLLPVIPFVCVIILLLVVKKHPVRTHVFSLFLGFLAIFVVVAYFSSMANYFRDSIYANYKYYIPTGGGSIGQTNYFSLFAPFGYLFSPLTNSIHINLIKIYSFILIFNIFVLTVAKKKYFFAVIFLLLGLANFRSFGIESMSFHLLPWYGLLIFSAVYTSVKLMKTMKNLVLKIVSLIFIVLVMGVNLFYTKEYFLNKANKDADAYINFSTPFDYGEAVRIMRNDNDRMFATYDGSLIYWHSGIDHAVPAVFYYPWMQDVPFIRKSVDNLFAESPPEFFIYQYTGRVELDQYLQRYKNVYKDNKPTYLYVLDKKYNLLTKEQYDGLNYYRFSF